MEIKNVAKSSFFSLLILSSAYATNPSQRTLEEHRLHTHKIDITSTTVYQQIKEYATVYNASHFILELYLTKNDKFVLNTSIAFGNGLTEKLERLGYSISTTADDLEDYLIKYQ